MANMWTRRALIGALSLPAFAQKGVILPADWSRYSDSATEFQVLRLTSPDYESRIAPPPAHIFSRNSRELVFASTRAGKWQAFRIDLNSGQCRQLSRAEDLDPQTVLHLPDERGVCWWDSRRLIIAHGNREKETELARCREGFARSGPAVFTDDSLAAFWIETQAARSQIVRLRLAKGSAEVFLDADGALVDLQPNPRRALLAWRTREGALWLVTFDGEQKRRIDTPPGRVLDACWNPSGNSIIYLIQPADPGQLHALREQEIDSRADKLLAKTTQFSSFGSNSNASVFVGASASQASPYVILLLRVTRRELTLCEHRSKSLDIINPQFSPNSQRIVFQSDRQGKPAIYSMLVEKFVEKTES